VLVTTIVLLHLEFIEVTRASCSLFERLLLSPPLSKQAFRKAMQTFVSSAYVFLLGEMLVPVLNTVSLAEKLRFPLGKEAV
jgi:hypothetical protein